MSKFEINLEERESMNRGINERVINHWKHEYARLVLK
ncbi:MAG: hypothetical protein AD073_000302 [Mycoplasmataceae bacterium]|nr:MAG: hypothetical protein AD073_000302 [Mycoplasmataceae bacterium]